jgi:hypothetical protein
MPRKPSPPPPNWAEIGIYGIWSKADKHVIFISLSEEDVELEYDMEEYSEETHVIVFLSTLCDISSLEP